MWFDRRLGALNSNPDAHLGKSPHLPGVHLLSLVEMGGWLISAWWWVHKNHSSYYYILKNNWSLPSTKSAPIPPRSIQQCHSSYTKHGCSIHLQVPFGWQKSGAALRTHTQKDSWDWGKEAKLVQYCFCPGCVYAWKGGWMTSEKRSAEKCYLWLKKVA